MSLSNNEVQYNANNSGVLLRLKSKDEVNKIMIFYCSGCGSKLDKSGYYTFAFVTHSIKCYDENCEHTPGILLCYSCYHLDKPHSFKQTFDYAIDLSNFNLNDWKKLDEIDKLYIISNFIYSFKFSMIQVSIILMISLSSVTRFWNKYVADCKQHEKLNWGN